MDVASENVCVTLPQENGNAVEDTQQSRVPEDEESRPPGHVRVNGFERPFSKDQVFTWLCHSISAVCFYVVSILVLYKVDTHHSSNTFFVTVIALGIHIPTTVLLVAAWISCERIDPSIVPASGGWFGMRLDGSRWEKTRYCSVCRKYIPGLDHHCTWLQNCVGQANYAQFFTIACTGTLKFAVQAVYASFAIFLLDLPYYTSDSLYHVVYIPLIICGVISTPCLFLYVFLLGFHISLYFLGYGTYEWFLRRRDARREKLARKREQEKCQPAEGTTTSL